MREQELQQAVKRKEEESYQMTTRSNQMKEDMKRKEKEYEAQAKQIKAETERLSRIAQQELESITQQRMEDQRAVAHLVTKAKADSEKAQALYEKEMQQRRDYLDQLEKLKGSISVYCRVRPLNSEENGEDARSVCFFPRPQVLELRGGGGGVKSFTYNEVFGPGSAQSDIFKSVVDPFVQDVLEGYNVCIFAYGQSGSGKTYTMSGIPGDPAREGVVPRSLRKLFLVKEHAAATVDVTLTFTMVDLFNDRLIDLLKGFTSSPDPPHHGEMHHKKASGEQLAVKKDLAGLVRASSCCCLLLWAKV
jgi:kinesin family protein C2/C3